MDRIYFAFPSMWPHIPKNSSNENWLSIIFDFLLQDEQLRKRHLHCWHRWSNEQLENQNNRRKWKGSSIKFDRNEWWDRFFNWVNKAKLSVKKFWLDQMIFFPKMKQQNVKSLPSKKNVMQGEIAVSHHRVPFQKVWRNGCWRDWIAGSSGSRTSKTLTLSE
jgi:hypothetical protein